MNPLPISIQAPGKRYFKRAYYNGGVKIAIEF